jgi:hypothetical protein
MGLETSRKAEDRRAFLRRLGQGTAAVLLGLVGAAGAGVAQGKAAQEPKVLCLSREEYGRLLAEGKLSQAQCCSECCPR